MLISNSSIKFNDASFLYVFIIAFSFFPYITFYSFGSDIQPWSILTIALMSLLLFFNNVKFSNTLVFLFLPFFYAFFLVFVSTDYMSAIRSLLGYLTVGLVPLVFYLILEKHYKLFVKFLKILTITYLIVGVVQLLVYEQFMSFLLNRNSTTDSRGVVSLVTEPTFYGIVCLFLILLFVALNIKEKKKYIYLLLFQIVVLAQSSMTIVFLMVFSFYYFIFKVNIKTISLVLFGIITVTLSIYNMDLSSHNIRVFQLINMFLSEPSNIFIADASINDRVSAIYFSIKGFVDNNFIANGFGTYSQYLNSELPKQNTFWWVSESNRIMSFYGGILFELGFVALLIPFVYSSIIFRAYKHQISSALLYFFFLNTILLTAIPLSFPFVGIYMATLLYKAKNETPNNPQ